MPAGRKECMETEADQLTARLTARELSEMERALRRVLDRDVWLESTRRYLRLINEVRGYRKRKAAK